MGLLSGAASVTRFNLPVRPQEIDFEAAAFRAIAPGSEVRESVGFVPVEPEAEYAVGAGRWAFRVRVDRLRASCRSAGRRPPSSTCIGCPRKSPAAGAPRYRRA